MVHEFATEEGQARLSRALEADYEARDERIKEQDEFEENHLHPWFDSLTDSQKDQLAEWFDLGESSTTLGLARISYMHCHKRDIDGQDNLDL